MFNFVREGEIETEAEKANGVCFNVAASFSCVQAMNQSCHYFFPYYVILPAFDAVSLLFSDPSIRE